MWRSPPKRGWRRWCYRGQERKRAYVARLRTAGLQVVGLDVTRDPAATLDAMRSGADVIVQAPLGAAAFFGVVDVLLRVSRARSQEPSKRGPDSTWHGHQIPLPRDS
ncbi:MAG TPA: hypothetical protein VFZ65_02635 [Planctomycetota bacterium]|nr:hypothetical protein [Planctomycetota bacterium]